MTYLNKLKQLMGFGNDSLVAYSALDMWRVAKLRKQLDTPYSEDKLVEEYIESVLKKIHSRSKAGEFVYMHRITEDNKGFINQLTQYLESHGYKVFKVDNNNFPDGGLNLIFISWY